MHSSTQKRLEDSFTAVPPAVDGPANSRRGVWTGTVAAPAGERPDPAFREVLADDVGSAQERRRLRHRAQRDAITRRVRTLVGVGLIAIGALLVLAAVFTLAAHVRLQGRPTGYANGPGSSTWTVPSGSVVMPRAFVSWRSPVPSGRIAKI
jgi:hypothetical protein